MRRILNINENWRAEATPNWDRDCWDIVLTHVPSGANGSVALVENEGYVELSESHASRQIEVPSDVEHDLLMWEEGLPALDEASGDVEDRLTDDAPEIDEPWDGFLTDAEADADVFRSCGWGTDEDYGYYGGDEEW